MSNIKSLPGQIPAELRLYRQWVCHRADKVPLNPYTGGFASVTNPAHWSDFDTAVHAAYRNNVGIGFVFNEHSPFCGIDCDKNNDLSRRIVSRLNSYTEVSFSGRGTHTIVKGNIPHGRRRDYVEMYSHGRYFIMTGKVVNNVPIAERQDVLNILFNEMGGVRTNIGSLNARPANESDEIVIQRILKAKNGAKALALANGDASVLMGRNRSASEIDLALCNIIVFHTRDPEQVERIWLSTPIAQPEIRGRISKRPFRARDDRNYRLTTIYKAFDQTFALPNLGTGFDARTIPPFWSGAR